MTPLHRILEGLDRSGVPQLVAIYERCSHEETFFRSACAVVILGDSIVQRSASWLMKTYVKEVRAIPSDASAHLSEALGSVSHWESKLHLCQMLALAPLEGAHAEAAYGFLVTCSRSERPFVRAWALSALYRMKTSSADWAHEIDKILAAARSDPSKAVAARLRSLERKSRK